MAPQHHGPVVISDDIVAAAPCGIVVQSPLGELLHANASAAAILGVTSDDLRGRTSFDPLWAAIRPDGSPFPVEAHPSMVALAAERPVCGVIMGVDTPEGCPRWIEVDAHPLVRDGELLGVATYFTDVTVRWNVEHALTRTQGRLDLATHAGRVGIFEWDLAAKRLTLDDIGAEILDHPELDDTGDAWRQILDVVHADDRDRATQDVIRAATGQPLVGQYRLVPQHGRQRVVELQSRVVEDHGSPVRLVGALVDVSELVDARGRVTELLESMTDAYYTLDDELRFTYVNRAAEMHLGRSRCELLGKMVWDVFPEARGTLFEASYASVLEEGDPAEFESHYAPLGAWFEVRAHRVPGGLAVYFRDVTARHAAEVERDMLLRAERTARVSAERASAALAHVALHDALTGLPNRTALERHLSERLEQHRGSALAVCYLDLDRFKLINDSQGHSVGDDLLVEVARRLSPDFRSPALLARVGGDEFVMVLEGASSSAVLDTAKRVTASLRDPFHVHGRQLMITGSIGIAFAHRNASIEALLRDADAALYVAKGRGGDDVAMFTDDVRRDLVARVELEEDLRAALLGDDIRPHYQGIFSTETGRLIGLEALARWDHPVRGRVAPIEFIPIAEETGLINDLGTKILWTAVGDSARAAALTGSAGLTMWVNTAPAQLQRPGFLDLVLRAAEHHELPLDRLGIEVTESALETESHLVKSLLDSLSARGVRIAIDDFGTGYSSLSRIHHFPVDVVKIDQSFVSQLGTSVPQPIIPAVTEVAHALGASICAEGVETPEQLCLLTDLGVDSVSGFHLAVPSAIHELAVTTEQGRARVAAMIRGRRRNARATPSTS